MPRKPLRSWRSCSRASRKSEFIFLYCLTVFSVERAIEDKQHLSVRLNKLATRETESVDQLRNALQGLESEAQLLKELSANSVGVDALVSDMKGLCVTNEQAFQKIAVRCLINGFR